MQTPTKLAAFAVALVTVFGGAVGLGSLVGPIGTTEPGHGDSPGAGHGDMVDTGSATGGGHDADGGNAAHGGDGAAVPTNLPAGGLMISQDGYTLQLADTELAPGSQVPVRFRILGPDGAPVTDYTRTHGKDLHLIAVRRDLSGYQHVHPTLAADGTWRTPLDLSRAGEWRVFADFAPAGADEALTLGADLSVPGGYHPQRLPTPTRTARVDGYTVTLDGALVPGEDAELTMSVSRDGRLVTDLQPYLEAYGHLVALRDGDLAYLHVHPDGSPGDGRTEPGPRITFYASVPSTGDYRLFLDFRHNDRVHTAAFTARATGDGGSTPPAEPDKDEHGPGAPGHRH